MALNANLVWEIQPGVGAAENGGAFDAVSGTPGTNYTYGAGATLITWKAAGGTYTNDLASTSASSWLVLTSASRNFVAADVGNVINITAGTNFTAGRYQIMSVAGNAATLDRACGATGDATAGTGYLGGAIGTIDTIYNVIVAGNTVWLKKGSDSITTARTLTAGTVTAPIQIFGYNAARGDLTVPASGGTWAATHTAAGFLDTTNFPTIALAANVLTVQDCTRFAGIAFTTSKTTWGILQNAPAEWFRCKMTNTSSGNCILVNGVPVLAFDCDLSSNTGTALNIIGGAFRIWVIDSCRITATNANGADVTGAVSFENCLFYNIASGKVAITQGSAERSLCVKNCTFYNCATCITIVNAAQGNFFLVHLINNHVTGCGTFVNNLRSGTQTIALVSYHNRLRGNTNGYVGFSTLTPSVGDITTDQDDATEYVDVATNDFHLNAASSGKGAGLAPYLDTGAWQRQEAGGGFPLGAVRKLMRRT